MKLPAVRALVVVSWLALTVLSAAPVVAGWRMAGRPAEIRAERYPALAPTSIPSDGGEARIAQELLARKGAWEMRREVRIREAAARQRIGMGLIGLGIGLAGAWTVTAWLVYPRHGATRNVDDR